LAIAVFLVVHVQVTALLELFLRVMESLRSILIHVSHVALVQVLVLLELFLRADHKLDNNTYGAGIT
jgi:hypothetical protein